MQYYSLFLEQLENEQINETKWRKRMSRVDEDWSEMRKTLIQVYVKSFSLDTHSCSLCKTQEGVHYVKCVSCTKTHCWECDKHIHLEQRFHERRVIKKDLYISILGS